MWIRSQNKEALVEAKTIFISEKELRNYNREVTNVLYCINSIENSCLGIYTSKEKALKVMDIIEDVIIDVESMRINVAYIDVGEFVFNMPQDDEVEA